MSTRGIESGPVEPTDGKGRPTPKRREAERRRRQPVTAPATRREAYKSARARARAERAQARAALRSGDERHLPARDAGPVKRYVRDVVDARRNAGNYLIWVAFAVVAFGYVRVPAVQYVILAAYPVILIWVVLDAVLLVRLVTRRVRARFPDAELRGLGGYALLRSFQIRRMRLPPPKVRIGERV